MKKIFVVAAILISSPFTALNAYAQQDTTKTLDEVVITATKSPQKQSTTGKVVSVITREEIERSTGKTIGRLLNEQAGITINGALNNPGTNQTLYIRGASLGRSLILIDGIPAYDPSLINSEFDLNLISLNDVERIEICRGAHSTLYGSDAIGGVINIITVKKDVSKPVHVKATLSGGNFGTFKGNAQVYGQLGKFGYTTRYAKLYTHGFSAAQDTSKTRNFDRDAYNGDVYSAALRYNLSEAFSLRTFIQNSRYKNEIDASVFSDERDYAITNKNIITGGGFHFDKGIVRLTSNYQFSETKRHYVNDSSFVPQNSFTKFATDDYFGKTHFAELFAHISLGSGFNLLQGADYRFANMNQQYFSLSPGPLGPFNPYRSSVKDSVQSQASLYASLFYTALQSRLNVELGGRLNVHSRYGSNKTFTFNPSFSFNDHFRLFGSIATGFKAPTLYHLYSSYGSLNLQPEKSKTYEIGLQQLHDNIQTRVVYFHRDIENAIDFNNLIFRYFNIIRQQVSGLEVETGWQPVEGLSISANYTYLNPEEKSQSRITFKDTTYDYLLRRPGHNLNINAGYTFSNGLYTSAGAKYVSSRYDVGGYRVPDVALDGYLLLHAYAEYSLKKYIKLFADAQNLTNRKFTDVRGYNSIPFLISGGITFSW